MLKIAVCDDNKIITNNIEKHIEDLSNKYNELFEVDAFYSGNELANFYEINKYDMLFLDIEMEGLDGISLANKIRQTEEDTLIIFVSSYKSYLDKIFDVQPFNFINKPIDWTKFDDIFNKGYKKIQKINYYFNFISERASIRVAIKHIILFEKIQRKIFLVTNTEKYEINNITLKEISTKLNNKHFIYATQSDLINMEHVEKIYPEYIILSNGQKIFVSRRRQKQVKEVFKKMWQEDILNVNIF